MKKTLLTFLLVLGFIPLFSSAQTTGQFIPFLRWTNATGSSATTTNFFTTTASTTNFFGAGLPGAGCTTTNALTYNGAGKFTCTAQPQGTVTAVSVASANGFAGSSSGGATPALTLTTSISGLLKGNGTAISAASSGTDYAPATSGSSLLYGNGAGGFSNATVGTGLTFLAGNLSATGGSGVSTSTATTTVYINQNNTLTPNGTVESPYTTISSAIKSYPADYVISGGGTYIEGGCNLNFTATSTIEMNQSVLLCFSGTPFASAAGQITFAKGIILKDAVIATGNVSLTDPAVSDPGTITNSYLGGNITLSGFSTIQGGQLTGGEIYTKPGSLTAFSFNEINDLVGIAGVANLDTLDLNVSGVGSGKYALTASTSGSVIQVNGMSLENLAANGGGIYCNNSATASQPNAVASMSGAVATTTNSGAFNCGSAALEAGPYAFTSTTNGQRLFAVDTNPINFSFLGLNTEGTTTLAQLGGFVGIGTTTPARTLDVVGTSAGTTLTSASLDTISLTNTDQTNNNFEDLSFLTVDSAGSTVIGAKMSGIFTNHTTGAVSADLAFVTKHGGTTAERLRINSWGAVGIGTTTPQWLLQLASSTRAQLTLSDASLTSNHWSFRNAGGILYLATSSPSTFATSSVSALTIDANGQLTIPFNKGVGCAQFDANGALGNTGSACGSGSGAANSKWATSTGSYLGVTPNGGTNVNVGIGTSTPIFTLHTASTTGPQFSLDNPNGPTDAKHLIQDWTGSQFRIGTSSDSTFTSTSTSLTLTPNSPSSLSVGSTTPTFSAVNGLVTLGANGASSLNASTTISMGKIQFDGYSNTGARTCMYVVGTSLIVQAGACTP